MKARQTIFHALGVAAALCFIVTACDNSAPDEKADAPVPAAEETVRPDDPESEKSMTVRGVLRHFPQNVKSAEAWLGNEFMVGETPVRTTETVPREELMKMVGETVEIEGLWNAGKTWEPPRPTDEGFALQSPSYPEGVTVIRGSGLEASSVKKIEK